VSDKLNPGAEHCPTSIESPTGDDALSLVELETTRATDREGLPHGYRMRADRHYVEQLAAPSAVLPVLMVPVSQIDSDGSLSRSDLRPLVESVRLHGIVHPLLVRRQDSRYAVVAGRKRLAVAHTLRLTAVPCLVHDVDEAQAAALEAADNLRIGVVAREKPTWPHAVAVQHMVADHVTTIRACADMVVRGVPAMNRSMLELIRAHSWRAARLVDALDLIANAPASPGRDHALPTIVDEVIDGFGPESRLNGFTIRAHVREDLSSSGLNDRELLAGLSGALLATLPLVEQAVRPTVVVRASNAGPGTVVLEVIQSDVPVTKRFASQFFEDEFAMDRPGGCAAAAGALAAKAVAERHGGEASFEAVPNGCRLELVLVRRS
jgi:ParB/RepB/Spo0J family partition protein